jgi:hypothetical protein
MEELVPIVMFAALAFAIVGVTQIISDGRTRRRLIESGASPELVQSLDMAAGRDSGQLAALKWGLVIGAVGLALIVVEFLPPTMNEAAATGIVLLFGATGLLVFYAIARRLARP